jgi:hypothetical protein
LIVDPGFSLRNDQGVSGFPDDLAVPLSIESQSS